MASPPPLPPPLPGLSSRNHLNHDSLSRRKGGHIYAPPASLPRQHQQHQQHEDISYPGSAVDNQMESQMQEVCANQADPTVPLAIAEDGRERPSPEQQQQGQEGEGRDGQESEMIGRRDTENIGKAEEEKQQGYAQEQQQGVQ